MIMYKTFKALLKIVWILDLLNIPQLELLDTTYPINGWAWFLILIFIPSADNRLSIKMNKDNKK